MQKGLCLPQGAQAPVFHGQRKICRPKPSLGGRSAVFTTRVPATACSSRSRAAAVAVTASSSNGNLLPWQAAMDEVKKRKDLKSIMIIGAGPIVIGQVGGQQGVGVLLQPQLHAGASSHCCSCHMHLDSSGLH